MVVDLKMIEGLTRYIPPHVQSFTRRSISWHVWRAALMSSCVCESRSLGKTTFARKYSAESDFHIYDRFWSASILRPSFDREKPSTDDKSGLQDLPMLGCHQNVYFML
ncbi:hypothetical protein MPTK2_4g21600 [Marchantia polymorpha subsp. ruderalis]